MVDETEGEAPFTPTRLVLMSVVGLWLCYFVLTTIRGHIVGLEFQEELLWRRALVTVAGILTTLAMWPILRLFEQRSTRLRILVALIVALPASLVLAISNEWAFASVQEKVVAKIGEREGIEIRRDEAGNLLVDVPGIKGKDDAAAEEMAEHKAEAEAALAEAERLERAGDRKGAQEARDEARDAMQEFARVAQKKPSVTLGSDTNTVTRWRQLTDLALSRYFLLVAWAALYMALGYALDARLAERREAEYRRAARTAELRSLRYQVNPHFLFNTLNSLSALILAKRNDAAEAMIQTISTFYRRSLASDTTADVTLAEEVGLQQLYLEVETARFPERLKSRIDIPEDLAQALVPGMILQPLVENSVKHAVAPVGRPVTIAVAAHAEGEVLCITVSDDGPGHSDASTAGFGIGLSNVAERLRTRFGNMASVAATPVARGFATVIRLPLVIHG